MKQSKFPEGWNNSRILAVLNAYESQSDAEAVAEDEAAVAPLETFMSIPVALVPQVRELIAKCRQHPAA